MRRIITPQRDAQQFRDMHKGKLAIICGCGPSLNQFTWNDFPPDSIIFCINQAILKFKHPDYWFAVDREVTKEKCWDNLLGAGEIIITEELHDLYDDHHKRVIKLYRDALNWHMHEGSQSLVMGRDAVQSCTHLALIMGVRAVALLGCDMQLVDNKKYFMSNPGYDNTGDNSLTMSNDAWDVIIRNNPDAPIYNCSPSSALRAVTKIHLKNLTNGF